MATGTHNSIAVVGAAGVGKTKLVQELCYLYSGHNSNEGPVRFLDWPVITLSIQGNLYRCTDTRDEFCTDRAVQLQVIHSHRIFLLMYAVNDRRSFEEMERLKSIIQEIKKDNCIIVIVGNKIDQKRRILCSETIDCLITIDWELPHVEVVAKVGMNVERVINRALNPRYAVKAIDVHRPSLSVSRCVSFIIGRRHSIATIVSPLQEQQTDSFYDEAIAKRYRSKAPRRSITRLLRRCTSTEDDPSIDY